MVTTNSAHGYRTHPNRLAEAALHFVYLAYVLDAFSRRCVGWKLSRQIDTCLTLASLEMALQVRRPAPGLSHHSDWGVQYASAEYIARLEQAHAQVSRSAT